MKTLAIISRKGGTGKTTLAVHLAVEAVRAGHTVALIDLDPQASACEWRDIRTEQWQGDSSKEAPTVVSVHSSRLASVLHTAKHNGVTLAILDTSPKVEDIALDAAKSADFAIVPCRAAVLDLRAIEPTINVGKMAKCPMSIVFNAVRPRSAMLFRAKRAVKVYGVDVSPCVVSNRVTFEYALVDGLVAQEYEPKGKASIEIESLYRYISKQMEASHGTTSK